MVPTLHIICPDRVLSLPDFVRTTRAILALGPDVAVHLRSRLLPGRALARFADALTTHAHPATLIVNDRVDVALATGADGVHLPERGLETSDARRLLGPERLIGRSTHEGGTWVEEDYVFVGPLWETASHPGTPGRGVNALSVVRAAVKIAIGGVRPDRVADARRAGAHGVAAIGAVWDREDPAAAARALLVSLERWKHST